MTIFNFDWATFRYTLHTMNWYEAGMALCFVLAGIVSIRTTPAAGKNRLFQLLVVVGAALGLAFKLLAYLDVTVVLYAALLGVAIADLVASRRASARQAKESETARLQRRRQELSGGSSGRHEHGDRSHSHHSHEHGSHHHHAHTHEHGVERTSRDVKEPLYGDPLADENENGIKRE